MVNRLKKACRNLLHLFFPQLCVGCKKAEATENSYFCLGCLNAMPLIPRDAYARQRMMEVFYGRVVLGQVLAMISFEKGGMGQAILHEIKYRNHKELGYHMGQVLGRYFLEELKQMQVDMLIPIPLHPNRLKKRGYNQSELLCKGVGHVSHLPVDDHCLSRIVSNESQTNKGRWQRWQNVNDIFCCHTAEKLTGKHLLLVDDVLTSGATMEAAVATLQAAADNIKVSVLCLAWAGWAK